MVKILEKNNRPAPIQTEKQPSRLTSLALMLLLFAALNWLFLSWLTPDAPTKTITTEAAPEQTEIINVPAREIKTDEISATIAGTRISKISLTKYKDAQLLAGENEFIEFGMIGNTETPTANTLWRETRDMKPGAAGGNWINKDGVAFRKDISFGDNYITTIKFSVSNKSKNAVSVAPYVRAARAGTESSMMFLVASGGIANVNGNLERESWDDLNGDNFIADTGANSFVGFEDQYWGTIMHINAAGTTRIRETKENRFQADLTAAAQSIPAGANAEFEIKIYTGPKSQAILNAANAQIPGVAGIIDYGWFSFLSRPFLWSLTWLHSFVGNYGLAIIFLTLILRTLMIPLTKKSYKSMAAMQKMQPELQRIQKLYGNDKARLQMEMMALYSKSGANPMSGCLPMLLQIPIFFALYKALIISVDMRDSAFLWVSDLASADPTSIFNLFGLLPWANPDWLPAIGILPILMGASMWIQMNMSSSASANMPGMKIMKWIPVIFVVMFAGLPAGLILYWTISNIFGLAQQKYILKKMK